MEYCSRITEALETCRDNLHGQTTKGDQMERFLLSSSCSTQNTLKCVVALKGDVIYEADIKVLKLNAAPYKATIKEGSGTPYRIQQIQDCLNFVQLAINLVEVTKCQQHANSEDQPTAQKLNDKAFLMELFNILREARNVLTLPRRKSIEEHMCNPSRKCFHPPVPKDTALSIFLRGHKLVFAAYILIFNSTSKRWEINTRYTVECVIPWLNEVILLLTFALETTLQLMSAEGC